MPTLAPPNPISRRTPVTTEATTADRPIVVDVFAGVGGLALGFEQAGFDIVAAIENDHNHAAVHRRNFPLTRLLERNAFTVTVEEIREAIADGLRKHGRSVSLIPTIDVVCGGPPCQGFSVGGMRVSRDGRNRLLTRFARIVGALQPRYFVLENVPGLLGLRHGRTVRRVLERLRGAGYVIAEPFESLNATRHGVPQNRERVVIMGWRPGEAPLHYPEGDASSRTTVRDALSGIPHLDLDDSLYDQDWLRLGAPTQVSDYVRRINGDDPEDFGYLRVWDTKLLTGVGLTRHAAKVQKRFAEIVQGRTEPISRFHRLEEDGVANTLRAGTGPEHGSHTPPRPIHPSQPRVITVREAARLHSFPDWFVFHHTKWHAWQQIGNSVPPLLARAVAKQVMSGLGLKPSRPDHVIAGGLTSR